MSDDQSAAGRRFQIHHDSLESAATRALPDQVSALGNTRRSLMARQVPVEAFGRVAASGPAGAGHAGTVAENARRLAAASGRLEEIIGGVRQVNAAIRDWDTRKAGELREQNPVAAAQARSPGWKGEIIWRDRRREDLIKNGRYCLYKGDEPRIPKRMFKVMPRPGDRIWYLRDNIRIYLLKDGEPCPDPPIS